MPDLIVYFHEYLFMLTFGGMAIFVLLEMWFPRRSTQTDQTYRLINNILLGLINFAILAAYAYLLGKAALYFQSSFTLVNYFQLSAFSSFLVILVSVDFIGYWIHRAFHKIPWLWQFHAVHHTDTEIDVTTSHRQSPIEAIIGSFITFPVLFFIGAPPIILVYFIFFHKLIELYAHSNIRLPVLVDSIMRKIIVTPDFHRMHHFSDRKYTDSNFSVVFPAFDYLFSTSTRWKYEDLPKVELGIEKLRDKTDNRIDRLLLTPFLLNK